MAKMEATVPTPDSHLPSLLPTTSSCARRPCLTLLLENIAAFGQQQPQQPQANPFGAPAQPATTNAFGGGGAPNSPRFLTLRPKD